MSASKADLKLAEELVRAIACPFCGAQPGRTCRMAGIFPTIHGSRVQAALKAAATDRAEAALAKREGL